MTYSVELSLLASGSNSHGQLGLGHREDRHQFELAHIWRATHAANLLGFAAGARHSLFLVEIDQRRILYGSGDRNQFQLPPLPSNPNLSSQQECSTRLTEIDYHALLSHLQSVDPELKQRLLEDYEFDQVACCWETSFVVLRCTCKNLNQPQCCQSDHIIAFGADDFDLRGSAGLLRDPSCPNLVNMANFAGGSSVTRVINLVGGPKHVMAVIEYTRADQGPSVELVGWGAARQAQLGPMQDGSKPPRSIKPTRLLVPFPLPQDPSSIRIALGNEHSVMACATHILCWGSNRKGQIPSQLSLLDPAQILELQACWHTTFVLTRVSPDPPRLLFGFGSNTQGQLGVPSDSLVEVQLPIRSSCGNLCAGSEHMLMTDGSQQVIGWGWNEHGNLGKAEDDHQLQATRTLGVVFSCPDDQLINKTMAGCATSFIVCERKCTSEGL